MKTILFLSPVTWKYSNTQIKEFVELLSKNHRIVYLHCYELEYVSLKHFILNRKQREKIIHTWKNILTSKRIVIPTFLTRNTYSIPERITKIDGWIVLLQIQIMLVLRRSENCVYANTAFFPLGFTNLRKMKWVFDFYDRSYDVTSKENNSIMFANEKWLLRNSDLVLVKSKYYLSDVIPTIESVVNSKVEITKIGYSVNEHLKVYPCFLKSSGNIVIGYAGGLSERLDYKLIIELVEKYPEISFVFAGRIYKNIISHSKVSFKEFSKKLLSYQNVKIEKNTTSKRRQAMIMSKFTFGWIPYDTTEYFNKYCHPTKFLEYMAVGIPVISTRIPSLIEHSKHISFINSAKSMQNILQNVDKLLTPNTIYQRKQFAIEHSIENRYTQISSLLKAVL
jgi:glycosyltransferase involved in cell wall biosynthesis